VAFTAGIVQDSVSIEIFLVNVKIVLRLQQVDESLDAVVLYTHEKHIFAFCGPVVHVGTALLQKLDHLQVAMQSCVQQRDIALLIRGVYPCSQLICKRRLASVQPCAMI
jgi:hypothetical protein